ncbi:hypothetical protein [Haliangium sp.]|uniref:hypothetical protein n=1 Tax=Haliangium sp. TaxID=2663208 RepID=UPI003D116144
MPALLSKSATATALAALLVSAAAAGAGCRDCQQPDPAPARGDAGAAAVDQRPPAPLPPPVPLPLGKASLAEYAYSRGPSRPSMVEAARAEEAGAWPTVERAAAAALEVDPGNLEAAWLLAEALIRRGAHAEALAPLSTALAGDWLRWGERSADDPLLAPFRSSPAGAHYQTLAEGYRDEYLRMLGDGLLVVGRRGPPWYPTRRGERRVNHRSEVYAYGLDSGRFIRASRTNGAVVGYVRAPDGKRLLYAGYRVERVPAEGPAVMRDLVVGEVDLERGQMSAAEVRFEDVVEIELGYAPADSPAGSPAGSSAGSPGDSTDGATEGAAAAVPVARVTTAADPGPRDLRLDLATGQAVAVATSAATRPEPGQAVEHTADRLVVSVGRVHQRRLPAAGVLADWDDAGTAGAFRLVHTRKTVTLAAGESADGHSLTWSPGRVRLAIATAALDPCAAEPAQRRVTLYVVEAATGVLEPVATGEGDFAPIWMDDSRLAYMQGHGDDSAVTVVDVTTGEVLTRLEGPGGVATTHLPRRRCPPPLPSPTTTPVDAGP